MGGLRKHQDRNVQWECQHKTQRDLGQPLSNDNIVRDLFRLFVAKTPKVGSSLLRNGAQLIAFDYKRRDVSSQRSHSVWVKRPSEKAEWAVEWKVLLTRAFTTLARNSSSPLKHAYYFTTTSNTLANHSRPSEKATANLRQETFCRMTPWDTFPCLVISLMHQKTKALTCQSALLPLCLFACKVPHRWRHWCPTFCQSHDQPSVTRDQQSQWSMTRDSRWRLWEGLLWSLQITSS